MCNLGREKENSLKWKLIEETSFVVMATLVDAN
jgi:hypothetical protein